LDYSPLLHLLDGLYLNNTAVYVDSNGCQLAFKEQFFEDMETSFLCIQSQTLFSIDDSLSFVRIYVRTPVTVY